MLCLDNHGIRKQIMLLIRQIATAPSTLMLQFHYEKTVLVVLFLNQCFSSTLRESYIFANSNPFFRGLFLPEVDAYIVSLHHTYIRLRLLYLLQQRFMSLLEQLLTLLLRVLDPMISTILRHTQQDKVILASMIVSSQILVHNV